MTADHQLDPRFVAGVDMLAHTGAKDFRVGTTHEDDGPPIVWYAVATWDHPVHRITGAEAAAALTPVEAVMRLCEQVIDGGQCTHCGRLTVFVPDPRGVRVNDPLHGMGCVYGWDPKLAKFRRSCQ